MRRRGIVALGFMLLALAPVVLFYPALMNADSLDLWTAALRGGVPGDWHSPFLVTAFRAVQHAGLGVAFVTTTQVAGWLLAFAFLLGCAGVFGVNRLAVLAIFLFLPPTLTWLVAVEKTSIASVLLCGCFVVSVAIAQHSSLRRWLLCWLLLLALAGTWCRPNGLILFLPLVTYAALRAGLRRGAFAGTLLLYLTLSLGIPAAERRLGMVQATHPEQATIALDLLNMSFRTGRDLLPPGMLIVSLDDAARIMRPQPFPPYDGMYSTLALRRAHVLNFFADDARVSRLYAEWFHAIVRYPVAYLRFRASMFRAFNCFDSRIVCYDSWHWYTGGIDAPNRAGLVSHHVRPVFDAYRALAGTVFYRPWFHAAVTLLLLSAALLRRAWPAAVMAATLLLYYASCLLLLPGLSVRMVVPLGLMEPLLFVALFTRPGYATRVRTRMVTHSSALVG